MKLKRNLSTLCALALCAGLAFAGSACSDDGGDDDAGPDVAQPDADPNPGPMPDPNPGPMPGVDPDPTCGDGSCDAGAGEDSDTCPADCPPDEVVCENVGDTCIPGETGDGNGLTCVLGGDSTDVESATCHQICDVELEDEDCPRGSFCADLQDGNAVCIRSNCTSTFNSVEECAGVGANGGTCFETSNDGHYCFPAGEAAEGGDCVELEDCGPGLFCLDNVCQGFCANEGGEPGCDGDLLCLPLLNSEVVGVCGEGCSGFGAAPEECGEGSQCFPIAEDLGLCQAAGEVAIGELCNAPEDCAPGGLCQRLNEGDPSTCQSICDRREGFGDETCPENEICLEINDVSGVCFGGCTPLLPEDENGCTEDGVKTCIPIDDRTRGLCLESGTKVDGDACEFIDDSIFGDCQGNLGCLGDGTPDSMGGECTPICATFSSVNDYESGCAEGEVCEIFGLAFGLCSDAVANPPIEAFSPCQTAGQWCSDDVLCLQVDQQGNNLCIPVCRLGSDVDCPDGPQGPTTCDELLASDALGLCVP